MQCYKKSYTSRDLALRAKDLVWLQHRKEVEVYTCMSCGKFHLTSQSLHTAGFSRAEHHLTQTLNLSDGLVPKKRS